LGSASDEDYEGQHSPNGWPLMCCRVLKVSNPASSRARQPCPCPAFAPRPIAALVGATLDALLPEPLERVRVREERQRAKVRAAPFHCA